MIEIKDGGDNIKSFNVDLLYGDKTGYIHIQDHQDFFIEYDIFKITRSVPKVNFIVEKEGKMFASTDFRPLGIHDPVIKLAGHLAGVMNLTLDYNRRMEIAETASNSRYIDGQYQTLENGKNVVKAEAFINTCICIQSRD